ncbi:PAS domain-containing protein [Pontibacter qinzhouensis]|uniref:histidine kinase n=1 Tax=Pontibacter qinzhouensis TaxID=2603253 RepID=A0A5C8KE35_9BACT|nr:PAS domain-containing sensor histidine kinase [Pontibacter qinzhouensis]TXK52326.1 PAS domain-containing protein [Pontibacter qinzhouensis]
MDIQMLENIGKSSSKIFFSYNLKTKRFDYLNQAIQKIWGGSYEGFLANPDTLLTLIHPDDMPVLLKHYELLLRGQSCHLEFRLQIPDSYDKTIQLDAFPVLDEQQQVVSVTGIVEDITLREQYLAYLVEFTRKKNTALEIVAHDLRGPLAIVQSIAEALEKDHQEQVYDELSNYTRFIKQACESCVNIIKDVLSEEHLKSHKISADLDRVDIVDKIRQVIEPYAASSSISQTFELKGPTKAFALADEVKFDQIINNLIANSIKFTPPTGKITITVQDEPSRLLIMFHDNGVGIPEEDIPFIFDRFTKASRVGLSGEKSVGIGLSIVKSLVEIQGGQIWVESFKNDGTTFFMSYLKQ